MQLNNPYTADWYRWNKENARSSARVIVPLVLELVQPKSVIDVGCGTGEWLSVFKEHGVEDICGVDGAYVSRELLEIPEERFIPANLEQPLRINRKFDLIVTLEVAQALPNESAKTFVDSLTGLGPVVLFASPIPHQGGEKHITQEWPEYWAKLFLNKGYVVVDWLRRKIWDHEEVREYYAQNTIMFVEQKYLENQPALRKEYELRGTSQLSIVHPRMYTQKVETYLQEIEDSKIRNRLMRNVKRMVPGKVKRLVRAAMRRIPGQRPRPLQ